MTTTIFENEEADLEAKLLAECDLSLNGSEKAMNIDEYDEELLLREVTMVVDQNEAKDQNMKSARVLRNTEKMNGELMDENPSKAIKKTKWTCSFYPLMLGDVYSTTFIQKMNGIRNFGKMTSSYNNRLGKHPITLPNKRNGLSIKLSFNDRMDRVSAVRKLLPDVEKTAAEFKMSPKKSTTVMDKLALDYSSSLLVTGIPKSAGKEHLRILFPTADKISMQETNRETPSMQAILQFPSKIDASDVFMSSNNVMIDTVPLTLHTMYIVFKDQVSDNPPPNTRSSDRQMRKPRRTRGGRFSFARRRKRFHSAKFNQVRPISGKRRTILDNRSRPVMHNKRNQRSSHEILTNHRRDDSLSMLSPNVMTVMAMQQQIQRQLMQMKREMKEELKRELQLSRADDNVGHSLNNIYQQTVTGNKAKQMTLKNARSGVSSQRGGRKRGRDKQCYNCQQRGHRVKDCPQNGVSGAETASGILNKLTVARGQNKFCLNCQQPGHASKDCRKKMRTDDRVRGQGKVADYNQSRIMTQRSLTVSQTVSKRGQDKICFNCMQTGHLTVDCIWLPKPEDSFGGQNRLSVCVNGQQSGHVPKDSKNIPNARRDQRGSNNKCYNCKQSGHLAKDCSLPVFNESHIIRKRKKKTFTQSPKKQRYNFSGELDDARNPSSDFGQNSIQGSSYHSTENPSLYDISYWDPQ